MIRWGIAGTGEIARQIAADFAHVSRSEITAVCSRSLVKAEEFAHAFAIPGTYDDYSEMLAGPVDAIYIATPHSTHFAYVHEALMSGKHVLCEKPLAMNADEVRRLTAVARDSGVFLMEAMWMKFNPLVALLRDLIDDGAIGDVRAVRASFGAPFPKNQSSRWLPGGSALLDQGIYPVTLSHLLLGVPALVEATGSVRDDGVDIDEHFTLNYADGRFAQGSSSMVSFLETSASVAGDRGWLAIDPGFWFSSTLTLHTYTASGPSSRSFEVAREGFGYVPMLRAVDDAIARGCAQHPMHTHEDTVAVFDIMDRIRRRITVPREADRCTVDS